MKKLVLLVGSLLAVSAVASAKEVVPKPKAAPEVQVNEVIKEVPVEKIVYQDKIVEVPKVGPKGTFEVSYKVPFYKSNLLGDRTAFTFVDREGTLETKAEVEVAPKHKVRASAEVGLGLIPHKEMKVPAEKEKEIETLKKDKIAKFNSYNEARAAYATEESKDVEAKKTAMDEAKTAYEASLKAYNEKFKTLAKEETVAADGVTFNKVAVGYKYAHSDLVSIDGEFAIETLDANEIAKRMNADKYVLDPIDEITGEKVEIKKVVKSVKVAPTFDVKSYFFENDYVKAKEISLTPAYKYSWGSIPSNSGLHTLSLSGAAKFEGPYATEFGLDLKDFVRADILRTEEKVMKDGKPEMVDGKAKMETKTKTVVNGNVGIYAKKGFGLYENGNHKVDLDVTAGYKLKDFALSENAKGYVLGANNKKTRLNKDELYVTPELTYTYKINDYSKVYTTLDAKFAGSKDYRKEGSSRNWTVDSNVTAGLKVEF